MENGGQKVAAIKGCNLSLDTLCNHRGWFPEFHEAEKAAMKMADDVCEAEARRRAIHGVKSTVTTTLKDGSVRTYEETKYSDTILLRLLEKNETGSWRQKQQIEHSGGVVFKTAAERKKALEEARRAEGRPAINGLS